MYIYPLGMSSRALFLSPSPPSSFEYAGKGAGHWQLIRTQARHTHLHAQTHARQTHAQTHTRTPRSPVPPYFTYFTYTHVHPGPRSPLGVGVPTAAETRTSVLTPTEVSPCPACIKADR